MLSSQKQRHWREMLFFLGDALLWRISARHLFLEGHGQVWVDQ